MNVSMSATVRDSMPVRTMSDVRLALTLFGVRGWVLSVIGALLTAIVIGVPTVLITNPWFTRMTPVRPQDYLIWIATSVLSGLVIGSFAVRGAGRFGETKAISAGTLSYLAVGCPICNKVVVLLLGTSGALTFFAPLQLYLGLGSIALLAWTLRLRARMLVGSCSIPSASA